MDQDQVMALLEEVVWEKIESVSTAKYLLEDICHGDKGKLERILKFTILDSEYFDITDMASKDGRVYVDFEMPFGADAWGAEKEHLFHVTAFASGRCILPDEQDFDYGAHDFESMNKQELLTYGEMVRDLEICYSDVEVDG